MRFLKFLKGRSKKNKTRGGGKKKLKSKATSKSTPRSTPKATSKATPRSTPKSRPQLTQKLTPLKEALQKKEAAWEKYKKLDGDRSYIQRQLDYLLDDVSSEHTEERSQSLLRELEMIKQPLDDAREDFLDAQMEYESVATSRP